MTDFILRDANGSHGTHVNPRGQVSTEAMTVGAPGFYSRQGNGNTFLLSTGWVDVVGTGNRCFLWGKTQGIATNGIVIKRIDMFYDGGSTTGTKYTIATLRVRVPTPTGGFPTTPPVDTHSGNTNLGANSPIPMDLFPTNDTTNGLTLSGNGDFEASFKVTSRDYSLDTEDSIIMTPGVSMAMFLQPQETGKFCLNFLAYVLPEVT